MNDKKAVWMATAIWNLIIYGICLWLQKMLFCEIFFLAGTVICSVLYWGKREKVYWKEIGSVFIICAIFGLRYLPAIQMQGVGLVVLLIWFAFLEYYRKSGE